jgi:hypothetical protein
MFCRVRQNFIFDLSEDASDTRVVLGRWHLRRRFVSVACLAGWLRHHGGFPYEFTLLSVDFLGNHGSQGSLGIPHSITSALKTHVGLHAKCLSLLLSISKIGICLRVLVEHPNIIFYGNPFSGSGVFSRGQTDIVKLIDVFLTFSCE